MKAFLSYSLNDQDLYILTLISNELNNKGFSVKQSNDFQVELSPLTKVSLKSSQLVIGIITNDSDEKKRVLNEVKFAATNSIPVILLIEDTVALKIPLPFPYIQFDRHNPESAINDLKSKISNSQLKQEKDSSALAWILGGAALIAIIGLLFSDD